MHNIRSIVLAGVTALAMTGAAHAVTIDFGGLSSGNGAVFTGPYTEDGFDIATISGQVFEGHVFGNPVPSLVVGSAFDGGPTASVKVTRNGGGLFGFEGFDFVAQNGLGSFTVEGFLGATSIFSVGGSQSTLPFDTYPGAAGAIDSLVFSFTVEGTSINFDNIRLGDATAAVPEPASWALLIAGFGLAGATMRRSRRSANVSFA